MYYNIRKQEHKNRLLSNLKKLKDYNVIIIIMREYYIPNPNIEMILQGLSLNIKNPLYILTDYLPNVPIQLQANKRYIVKIDVNAY